MVLDLRLERVLHELGDLLLVAHLGLQQLDLALPVARTFLQVVNFSFVLALCTRQLLLRLHQRVLGTQLILRDRCHLLLETIDRRLVLANRLFARRDQLFLLPHRVEERAVLALQLAHLVTHVAHIFVTAAALRLEVGSACFRVSRPLLQNGDRDAERRLLGVEEPVLALDPTFEGRELGLLQSELPLRLVTRILGRLPLGESPLRKHRKRRNVRAESKQLRCMILLRRRAPGK
mmetsp:Transcript_36130/g.79414  ORF Transcript_36130/g.79414 Transcript_36130/m.79414 type:complete len:234 (+) Transcript_36130:1463-2164(+)